MAFAFRLRSWGDVSVTIPLFLGCFAILMLGTAFNLCGGPRARCFTAGIQIVRCYPDVYGPRVQLYHYTSLEFAKNICKTGELRAFEGDYGKSVYATLVPPEAGQTAIEANNYDAAICPPRSKTAAVLRLSVPTHLQKVNLQGGRIIVCIGDGECVPLVYRSPLDVEGPDMQPGQWESVKYEVEEPRFGDAASAGIGGASGVGVSAAVRGVMWGFFEAAFLPAGPLGWAVVGGIVALGSIGGLTASKKAAIPRSTKIYEISELRDTRIFP